MKTIFLFILTIIVIDSSAQVITKYYSDNQTQTANEYPLEKLNEISYNTNHISVKDFENKKAGIFRYGDVVPVDINLKNHGKWYNGKTWRLLIVSPNAKSIEVVFDNIILPEGAEINVFDIGKRMVFGPVNKYSIDQSLPVSTDIMNGDSIIVQLDLDENVTIDEVAFSIVKIVHGFKDLFGVDSMLKSAASCQVDVECSSGDGWEAETEGTAKIYGNGIAGSCALLNNTAQDFTPYILTAEHVIDGIGASNASIRFNYKATTCNGSTAASGITISGISVKASNSACDMALLESSSNLSNQTSIRFLGWNRVPNPSSVVCLHHPNADFMSISKESSSFSTINTVWVIVTDWDTGSIEPGSSGSPLFDHNKRVIATTALINSESYVCTSELKSYHGKLSYFWSSVSSFLDPCNTGATNINSIKTNTTLATISGDDHVCNQGATYQLDHELGDANFS